ncbi:MAG: cell division protein SepF [Kurthia sp.]|nr:cell division protein SepF [Candidatus Kurthia equi]
MKVKNVFKNFFYLDDEEEEYVENQQQQRVEQTKPKQAAKPSPKQAAPQNAQKKQQQQPITRQPMATPIPGKNPAARKKNAMPAVVETEYANNVVSFTQKTSKVVLFEPLVYSEAQDIGDCLKNKRAAVVNLQRIERAQGKRIIDFLSGTIFALNGDIKQVGTDIFLCTPDNVEVDGNISDYHFED